MEQNFPMIVQVAVVAASVALIALAAVSIRLLLQIARQCERVAIAVERVEAELTPLARDTRAAVDRVSDLSGSVKIMTDAAGGLLLPPVRTFQRAARLLRTGATTFLQALWIQEKTQ